MRRECFYSDELPIVHCKQRDLPCHGFGEFVYIQAEAIKGKLSNGVKGQITPKKSRTPLVEILLFDLKIPRYPFVLGKISYAICKSGLPLEWGKDTGLWARCDC